MDNKQTIENTELEANFMLPPLLSVQLNISDALLLTTALRETFVVNNPVLKERALVIIAKIEQAEKEVRDVI